MSFDFQMVEQRGTASVHMAEHRVIAALLLQPLSVVSTRPWVLESGAAWETRHTPMQIPRELARKAMDWIGFGIGFACRSTTGLGNVIGSMASSLGVCLRAAWLWGIHSVTFNHTDGGEFPAVSWGSLWW